MLDVLNVLFVALHQGVRRPVSLLFLLSGTQAACQARRQLPCCTPPNPPPLLPLPPSISLECYLSHDYTWDPLASLSLNQLLTPSPYPADFVFCPHINAEQSAEQKKQMRENRSRSWKAAKKRKKKDVSKCFLCNNFYPSHTFLLKATLLGTQKWVFLFGNNSRRASEATVKLLQSRCFFLSPINLTPTTPLSSLTLALAHQF